jgi:molybdenum cofactor cytidylyltransferase
MWGETTPARAGPIAGVLLAAGSSSRMGENKLLLRLGGEALVRRSAATALAAGLDPLVVVLGHDAERVRGELAGLRCELVVNPHHARGMNGSVRCGVAAVPERAPAAVVLLADMPLVTAGMVRDLLARYRAGAAPLVVSEYGGVLAPPMLYDRSLFGELGEQEGDGCGKRVVKRHRAEAEVVAHPAAALADLDAPVDYERVRAALGDRAGS